jgi:hypothetical protein
MVAGRSRDPEDEPTFEYGSEQGIRVTIIGEDRSEITYFGGKKRVKIIITSVGGPVKLLFSNTIDPPAEGGYEERAGRMEA